MDFIDLKTQYRLYKEDIDKAIHEVLDSSQYIMGPQVRQMEEVLADYVGVEHCISVSSGTDSLLMALMALGIGSGDEVITVPFTWVSTVEVIKLAGATSVLVDIDPKTFNMAVDQLEAAITPRTKAIMPVSLFGQMADMAAINTIADRHGIPVIEDAAQSFGAMQQGRRSCGASTVGSTSFFPAKPLGCYGDGGALFTNDSGLAERLRAIRVHGGLRRHQHNLLGLNGRFDTMQAAVILAKWPHFENEVALRERIGSRYSELLEECCQVPFVEKGNTHMYAIYTIRSACRDQVAAALKEKGIPAGIYYPRCVHQQPAYADLGYEKGSFPVSECAADEVLSLPMHPWLTESDQDVIIDAVKEASLAAV